MERGKYDKEAHEKAAENVEKLASLRMPMRVGFPDGPSRWVEAR